jgi:hypothetical protein
MTHIHGIWFEMSKMQQEKDIVTITVKYQSYSESGHVAIVSK